MSSSSDLESFDAAWRYLELVARQSTGAPDTVGAIDELGRRGEITDRERSLLTGARQLRNALTHTVPLPSGVPLAVPTDALVELLQTVGSRLGHQPPLIGDLAVPAHQVAADMPAQTALQELFDEDFSQAPYRTAEGRYRLFTAEQVARWLALQDGPSDLRGVTVAEVACFGPGEPAADLKPTKPTQAAVELLVGALRAERSDVVPVLLVRDRRAPEDLRLFTPADLPRAQPLIRPVLPTR